jgi:hypothetical protein
MPDRTAGAEASIGSKSAVRTIARWMVTFIGFPAGGFAALLIVGPVDSLVTAAAGGLITGAILGAVQSFGLGRSGPRAWQWISATAIGLTVGLVLGATAVEYATSLTALVIQGAVTGLAVGAAQAIPLGARFGPLAFAWPAALAVIWAIGWAITTSIGVQVDDQFTVFGSAGAIVVTALTAVLPVLINRNTSRDYTVHDNHTARSAS